MQNTKEILKQVKKIDIATKRLTTGLIAGNYHSVFKGQGIEFSEIREYRPGDDIRSIDWKVTARFNTPFVKEFIEERDLNVYFVFDLSASNNFGNLIEKKRKSLELCATLMFSAVKNNDNIGLFIITNKVEKYIPSRKGKRHMLKLISTIISYEPKNKVTDIKKSLSEVYKIIKKRSVIFIISDFYNQDFEKEIKQLKKRHDVIAIKVGDKREFEIPDVGLIELEDEETGEQILVDTSDKEFRENYKKIVQKEEDRLNNLFKKNKIDVLKLDTDLKYETVLKKFFRIRKMRA